MKWIFKKKKLLNIFSYLKICTIIQQPHIIIWAYDDGIPLLQIMHSISFIKILEWRENKNKNHGNWWTWNFYCFSITTVIYWKHLKWWGCLTYMWEKIWHFFLTQLFIGFTVISDGDEKINFLLHRWNSILVITAS